uniref:Uncharacterized protein n=1 Tax=viral metagenome TaxID=1070528 RepID=A0A6H1ZJR8_9ZZZZ
MTIKEKARYKYPCRICGKLIKIKGMPCRSCCCKILFPSTFNSEEEALDLWVEHNRDYLEEKSAELECDIFQLGETQILHN